MANDTDSVKIEHLCQQLREIKDQLTVLPGISAALERQKLQDEHFKENLGRVEKHVDRLYNLLDEHKGDDKKSFDLITEKLNTIDAKPGKIALSRNEKWFVAIVLIVILAMGNSWIQLQKLEIAKAAVAAQK
jgi:hypothetical protein